MLISPETNSFSFLGLNIRFYSVVMFVALLCAAFFSYRISKKYFADEVTPDFILDLLPLTIIFGIIGARIYYVALSLPFYLKYPLEIFAVWHGGLSIHGAIIFGAIFVILYCLKHKKNFLIMGDVFAPSLALGQAIGRWGNFFNSEAFGIPTNLPWGLYIYPKDRPASYIDYNYFHPTFLYESVLDLIICIILYFILKNFGLKKHGLTFFLYLILYSLIRFFIEIIRVDSVLNIKTMPIAQIVSIIIFIFACFGLYRVLRYDSGC